MTAPSWSRGQGRRECVPAKQRGLKIKNQPNKYNEKPHQTPNAERQQSRGQPQPGSVEEQAREGSGGAREVADNIRHFWGCRSTAGTGAARRLYSAARTNKLRPGSRNMGSNSYLSAVVVHTLLKTDAVPGKSNSQHEKNNWGMIMREAKATATVN